MPKRVTLHRRLRGVEEDRIGAVLHLPRNLLLHLTELAWRTHRVWR